jgi:hypothetical protein
MLHDQRSRKASLAAAIVFSAWRRAASIDSPVAATLADRRYEPAFSFLA